MESTNIDNSPSPTSLSSISSDDEISQTRTATLRSSYSSNDIGDSENESPQHIKSIDLVQSAQNTERTKNAVPFRKCQSVVHLTAKEKYKNSITNSKYRHTIQIPLAESSIKLNLSAQNTIFNVIKKENFPCERLKRFLDSCKVNKFTTKLK